MRKGRGPFGLPDFARGKNAIGFIVFGALWTIMAIISKQHWLIVLIGVFIMCRGTVSYTHLDVYKRQEWS